MKFIWEEKDIIAGRIVCKPPSYQGRETFSPCGNSVKWTYKIGYINGGDDKRNALICMCDGLIMGGMTKLDIVERLNKDGMIPMPHKWLIQTMDYLRGCYEGN